MFSKHILPLSFLASLALGAIACGGAPPSEAIGHKAQASIGDIDPALTACAVDADCVAVPQAGCCPNGSLAAVNADQVCAYYDANACQDPSPICPLFIVNDTRVAQCNITTKACEMVAIDQIKCGGFIANAHACPEGYRCQLNPRFGGDIPGSCVQPTSDTASN